MDNYESELSDLLIKSLQKLYGVQSEEIAYRIYLIRCCVENYESYKKYDVWKFKYQLSKFLIEELNLPLINGELVYKNHKFSLYTTTENSINNILDSWNFRYTETITHNIRGESIFKIELIQNELHEVFSRAEKITKVKKRMNSYMMYFKRSCLEMLNEKYEIHPEDIGRLDGFEYPLNHNDFKATLDEKYDMLFRADCISNNPFYKLSEDALEKYLIKHLNFIEDGLKLIKNQFIIDNGRLDILAKDKNGDYTIIELKVEDDTDVIFQAVYYRVAIKERFNAKNVRMVVIAPSYPEYILKSLMDLKNIEIYTFNAQLEFNRISNLELNKIA